MTTIASDRTNLDPLTTVFTAKPACSIALMDSLFDGRAWRAQSCMTTSFDTYYTDTSFVDDKSCYPFASLSGTQVLYDASDLGLAVFSPGLYCPSGYTTACVGYAGSTGVYPFLNPITGSETAAACCPVGFGFQTEGAVVDGIMLRGQKCISTLRLGSLLLGECTGEASPKLTACSWSNASNPFTVAAQVIQLVWQPSDLAISGPSVTTATTATTSGTAATTTPPKSSSKAISMGAVIGMSVGGAALLVAIIAWTT